MQSAPGSAHSIKSAHGEGAGPRGVSSAAKDEKLVPDIYLTLPGSSDAPRSEVFTADSLMSRLWSGKDRGRHFFSLSLTFSSRKKPFTFPSCSYEDRRGWRKVCRAAVFLLFGCSCSNLQVVNRFLVPAVAQSTAISQQSSLSRGWDCRRTKIWALYSETGRGYSLNEHF